MRPWPVAVLFDFDGVIVNSEPVHLRAFQLAAATEGIDLSAEQYYRELIGYDDIGAWRRLFQLHGKDQRDRAALARVANEKFAQMRTLMTQGQVQALPGARELIESLHPRCPLAICSAAVRDEVTTLLRAAALESYFNVVVCAEDVPVGKPDPSPYLLTMQRVSEMIRQALSPADCLIIEDAPAVVRSVREAGFKVLGVTTTCPAEKFVSANWVVSSLRAEELCAASAELCGLVQGGANS